MKRALCVGINDYPVAGADLKGCVNDAKAWAAMLIDHFGFDPKNITMLLDSQATKKRVLSEVDKLLAGAQKGDVVVFTNSSHGTYVADRDGDESRYDEAMCPWDMGDLHPHEVTGGIDATAPGRTDQRHHRVDVGQACVDHILEPRPGRDRVDVAEHVGVTEDADQLVVETPGEVGVVRAAVRHEDAHRSVVSVDSGGRAGLTRVGHIRTLDVAEIGSGRLSAQAAIDSDGSGARMRGNDQDRLSRHRGVPSATRQASARR